MSEEWTRKLSEYLDADLSGEDRSALEARLEKDHELRSVLEELRAVRSRARALVDGPPETDLWPGIAARLAPDRGEQEAAIDLVAARRARRRFSFSPAQLAAASVALVALGSGVMWVAADFASRPAPVATDAPAGQLSPALVAAPDGSRTPSYETAIRDLEERLAVGRERLDPSTVRILEGSLATIDRAIVRAQDALAADPANAYLNRHLADAMTRKLQLLRHANALATAGT